MTLETSANITIGHLFKAGSPVAYFVSLYLKYDTQHANNSPHDWSTKRNSIPKSQAQREKFKRTALSCAEDIYTLSSLCLNSNCKWLNTNAWPVKIIKLLFSTLNDKKKWLYEKQSVLSCLLFCEVTTSHKCPETQWLKKKKFPVKSWNQSFCYVEKLKKSRPYRALFVLSVHLTHHYEQ